MQREIQVTEDGSHTLRVVELDECYHSTHGAIQESKHIFIKEGLWRFLSADGRLGEPDVEQRKPCVNVLEIGFGTGLNAFLTLLEAEQNKILIQYTSLELYPLIEEEALLLNYPEVLQAADDDRGCPAGEGSDVLGRWDDTPSGQKRRLFERLHQSTWGLNCAVSPYFLLHKIDADFTGYDLQGMYDVIYFDAFSPEKQPEMWTEACFRTIFEHTAKGAVLTTYCAKGIVRRALQTAGFVVERLPGPSGKREILRASTP